MTLPNGFSRLASQNGNDQPPKRKPQAGSSSGPPGACITPSSDWKTEPVSLRIDTLPAHRRLDLRDVDLAHRHHRVERALRRGLVRTGSRVEQHARSDLPGEPPFVLAPAAFAFRAAVADDRIPVAVGLFLILGNYHQADGFIWLEDRAAVEADEFPPEHGEFDGQ